MLTAYTRRLHSTSHSPPYTLSLAPRPTCSGLVRLPPLCSPLAMASNPTPLTPASTRNQTTQHKQENSRPQANAHRHRLLGWSHRVACAADRPATAHAHPAAQLRTLPKSHSSERPGHPGAGTCLEASVAAPLSQAKRHSMRARWVSALYTFLNAAAIASDAARPIASEGLLFWLGPAWPLASTRAQL